MRDAYLRPVDGSLPTPTEDVAIIASISHDTQESGTSWISDSMHEWARGPLGVGGLAGESFL